MRTVRIGTRGSRLAKWQAEWVQSKLMAAGVQAELVVIQTLGDQQLETALYQMGSKGLFTKALDEALISNEIDLAVHSTKDIPTEFEDSLELGIILKREDPRDVLVGLREEEHDLWRISFMNYDLGMFDRWKGTFEPFKAPLKTGN